MPGAGQRLRSPGDDASSGGPWVTGAAGCCLSVCWDTGDPFDLLEDPVETAEAVAPCGFVIHQKEFRVAARGEGGADAANIASACRAAAMFRVLRVLLTVAGAIWACGAAALPHTVESMDKGGSVTEVLRQFAAGRLPNPMIILRFGDTATSQVALSSGQFRWVVRKGGAERVGTAQAGPVHVTLAGHRRRASTTWRVRLENRGHKTVSEVDFPILGNLPRGGQFTFPIWSGGLVSPAVLGPEEVLTLPYPAPGSLQFLDYFLPAGGLYLGVHDPVPWIKWLQVGNREGKPSMGITFSDLDVQAGQSVVLPLVYVAAHGGDWREGAAIYRQWLEGQTHAMASPGWYLRAPSWHGFSFRDHRAPKPNWTFAQVPERAAEVRAMGFSLIHYSGWFEGGEDTDFPDYFPGESYGGWLGMASSVARLHEQGFRVTAYTNARLMQATSHAARQGPRTPMCDWGVKLPAERQARWNAYFDRCWTWGRQGIGFERTEWDPQGTIPKEQWSGAGRPGSGEPPFGVMCPAARGWQDVFIARLAEVVRRTDVDGFQADQVCGAWCYPCYDPNHGHRRPTDAWSAYRSFMRRLRAAVLAIKPKAILWCEGPNDLLGESFDGCTTLASLNEFAGKWQPLPELFRASAPWLLVHLGANSLMDVRTAFVLGEALHCGTFIVTAPDRAFRAEVRVAQQLWQRLPVGFWRRPPVPIPAEAEGVLSYGYRTNNRVVITVAQADGPPRVGKFTLRLPRGLLSPGSRGVWVTGAGVLPATVDGKGQLMVEAVAMGAAVFDVAPGE